MTFRVNQSGQPVFCRVTNAGPFPVLGDAAPQVARNPHVEGPECLVRHDIDPAAFHAVSMRGRRLTNGKRGSKFRANADPWVDPEDDRRSGRDGMVGRDRAARLKWRQQP